MPVVTVYKVAQSLLLTRNAKHKHINTKYFSSYKMYGYSGADHHFLSPQPDIHLHYETTDLGLMHNAVYAPSICCCSLHIPLKDDNVELSLVAGYI